MGLRTKWYAFYLLKQIRNVIRGWYGTCLAMPPMANAEVFVYTRDGGAAFPVNVVRVQVNPSVTSIPANAFEDRKKLTKVELCESLIEIGEHYLVVATTQ